MRTGIVTFKTRPAIFVEADLPNRISITDGQHDCDYDVTINFNGNYGIKAILRARACKLQRYRDRGIKDTDFDAGLPLGLNQSDIDRFGGVVTWND